MDVKTHPNHFHSRNKKGGEESLMNGNPDHYIPLLIQFLKEKMTIED